MNENRVETLIATKFNEVAQPINNAREMQPLLEEFLNCVKDDFSNPENWVSAKVDSVRKLRADIVPQSSANTFFRQQTLEVQEKMISVLRGLQINAGEYEVQIITERGRLHFFRLPAAVLGF